MEITELKELCEELLKKFEIDATVTINDEEEPTVMIDEEYIIGFSQMPVENIFGTNEVPSFYLCRIVYYPGSYHEPPDHSEMDLETSTSLLSLMHTIGMDMAEARLDNIVESLEMEDSTNRYRAK